MEFPEFAKHTDKQKALDNALWLDFVHRIKQKIFSVVHIPQEHYLVMPTESIPRRNMVVSGKSKDYSQMTFEAISTIKLDRDPLWHWEQILGMFSVTDAEILRFILKYQVPLEKIIASELANRGYDENNHWIGFEKAKKIWLR
ncbi:MAG: hypothetical protein GKR88_17965 [Flavobacteriaceae bacterium]|nr:MAG: hypothetical protein GKR88_17965 [Flavobacteriaceae bacterium]